MTRVAVGLEDQAGQPEDPPARPTRPRFRCPPPRSTPGHYVSRPRHTNTSSGPRGPTSERHDSGGTSTAVRQDQNEDPAGACHPTPGAPPAPGLPARPPDLPPATMAPALATRTRRAARGSRPVSATTVEERRRP